MSSLPLLLQHNFYFLGTGPTWVYPTDLFLFLLSLITT